MAVAFDFRVPKLDAVLDRVAAGLSNPAASPMREGYVAAARIYLLDMRERYDRNMAGGGDWAPLAPSTVADKGGDARILFRTGRLRNALTPGSPDQRVSVSGLGLRMALTVPHGSYHQRGTARMPARKVMVMPSAPALGRMVEALKAAGREVIRLHWAGKRVTA